ncbi:bolA-like protein 3 [Hermetia illucens]|uniref:bolA-like protein 3 n=1 Tax=Hermetia illucens TaxID=343691 RepID=UPI0018CC0CAF|nr:bolA-like protein 3 [Hermetia illucens]
MLRNIVQPGGRRFISLLSKVWSGQQGRTVKYTESDLIDTLRSKFPQAAVISVEDVSGGCGAMFQISVESEEFKGVPIVKQHRMITETLKDHIKDMHGLRIHTSVPSGT